MAERPLKKGASGLPRQFSSTDVLGAGGLDIGDAGTHIIDKSGDDIQFTDVTVGTETPDSLRSKVRVSPNDTTPSNLITKLVAGLGISVTEVDDGAAETISIAANGGDFGTEFNFNEDEAEESTNSTTYIEKLKLTTTNIPAGDYVFEWYFEAKTPAGSGKAMDVRVQVDDVTTSFESSQVDTRDFWVGRSGFDFVTLTAGVHEIDMDYRKSTATANIRRARILGWRIA